MFGHVEPLKELLPVFERERESLQLSWDELLQKHEQEFNAQTYRYFDQVHVPKNLRLPASEAMLERLYKDNLVPKEKKEPVRMLKESQLRIIMERDKKDLEKKK